MGVHATRCEVRWSDQALGSWVPFGAAVVVAFGAVRLGAVEQRTEKKRKNWVISLISRVSGDPFPLCSVFRQHSHSILSQAGRMPVVRLYFTSWPSPPSLMLPFSCLSLLVAAPCILSRFYSFLQWGREVQWACLLFT